MPPYIHHTVEFIGWWFLAAVGVGLLWIRISRKPPPADLRCHPFGDLK